MEPEQDRQGVLEQERTDAQLRYRLIADTAREYFRGTALVKDKPWGEEDVEQVKQSLLACAPFSHPKVFPRFWRDLTLAYIYIDKIIERGVLLINPYEAEAGALLHDIGCLPAPHRYTRKDIIGDWILQQAGVRNEVLQKFHSLYAILGIKIPFHPFKEYTKLEDVPLVQRIMSIADNLGKSGPDGKPLDIQDIIKHAQSQPARYGAGGAIWASERRGLKALADPPEGQGKQKFAIDLLKSELLWLESTYGINLNQLREEVGREVDTAEYQSFLIALQNAQETLDLNVDRLLGRPPITKVVFDIGNVLWGGKDGETIDFLLAKGLAKCFGCTTEQTHDLLKSLSNAAVVAGKVPEDEYLKQFWHGLGRTPPTTIEELRAPFIQPEIYVPIEGMQDIVDDLSRNSKIELFCLSDSVASVTTAVIAAMQRHFPQIKVGNILVSSQLGAAKAESDGQVFEVLLKKVNAPNTQQVLFIDDNEDYSTTARANYNIRGYTFRGNPYKNLSASRRLRQELQKAELLL